MFDSAKELFGIAFMAVVAGGLTWETITSYRRGYVRGRRSRLPPAYERSVQPFQFWATLFGYMLIAGFVTFLAVAAAATMLHII